MFKDVRAYYAAVRGESVHAVATWLHMLEKASENKGSEFVLFADALTPSVLSSSTSITHADAAVHV